MGLNRYRVVTDGRTETDIITIASTRLALRADARKNEGSNRDWSAKWNSSHSRCCENGKWG